MNNKGFMMAELVVVASIIIITLTTFFTSYTKLIINYNRLVNYYDVGATYRLAYYYKNKLNDIKNDNNDFTETINNVEYKDKIYLVNKNGINNVNNSNKTFEEYKTFFNNSVKDNIETNNVLILESCQTKNNIEKCKYAYMEVPDE